MKEFIIFCQAPADVQYALAVYETNFDVGCFHFYTVNVENIFRYMTSLNLKKADVHFIPYPGNLNFKNIISIIKTKYYIHAVFAKYFKHKNNCVVYYFSNNFDWITFYCVKKLSIKNKVFNYDHYSSGTRNLKKNLTLKETYFLFIYKFITGIWFDYETINNIKGLFFNPAQYGSVNQEIKVSQNIYEKYSYKNEIDQQGTNALLFEADLTSYNFIKKYEVTMKNFVQILQNKGVDIHIKPHPRLGYSKFLDDLNLKSIPAYIPGEFISLAQYSAIFGIETVTIAKIAMHQGNAVYSILDLFDWNDASTREKYRMFLKEQSGGRVIFLKTTEDVKELKI